MKFQIGDKVNLCNSQKYPNWRHEGVTGVVIEIGKERIEVRWDTDDCVLCGGGCNMQLSTWDYYPEDIKLVSRKGQQLLFEFML